MSKIWITSDLHLGHNKSFIYEPRGFKTIEEHDAAVCDAWSKLVQPEDDIYVLGDLMLNDTDAGIRLVNALPGKLHVVLGNHDTEGRIERYKKDLKNLVSLSCAEMVKFGKRHFYLTHYPSILGNFNDAHGPINLHGHTHSKDKFQYADSRAYNIALDAHSCQPVSIEEIIEDIKGYRANHFN